MKKIIILLILFLIPINVHALEMIDISSTNYIVYDMTNKKIAFEKNSKEVGTVASLTKIITAITVIENTENLNKKITITDEILRSVPWDANKAGFKVNDVYTIKELLLYLMMVSAADAANALAYEVSGNLENFKVLMNEESKKIGLNDSYFSNAIGMDTGGNVSTAYDINDALLYALENEKFRSIFTTSSYSLENENNIETQLDNMNTYLDKNSKIYGYKTGYTMSSGRSIAAYFESKGNLYSVVLLHSSGDKENSFPHINDLISVVNFINRNYGYKLLVGKNDVIKEIKVRDASFSKYEIKIKNDIYKYLPIDYDRNLLKIEYTGLEELSDKNKKGEIIGSVLIYYDNELVSNEIIKLDKKITHTINQVIKKYKLMYIFIGLFSLVLFFIIFRK